MADDILKNIWNELSSKGKTNSEFDAWKTNVYNSEEVQTNVYGYLKDNGYTNSEFNDWKANALPAKTNDSASADPAVESNQNSTGSNSVNGFSESRDASDFVNTQEENIWLEDYFGKNELTDFVGDLWRAGSAGVTAGSSVDESFDLYKKGKDMTDSELKDFLSKTREIEKSGRTDEMIALTEKQNQLKKEGYNGVSAFFLGWWDNPSAMLQYSVQSLAQMGTALYDSEEVRGAAAAASGAGALAGGAAGSAGFSLGPLGVATAGAGAVTGMTAGFFGGLSGAMEVGMTTAQLMQEQAEKEGLSWGNLSDKERFNYVRKLTNDTEKFNELKSNAVARGIAIGSIDALTAGLTAGVGGTVYKGVAAGTKSALANAAKVGTVAAIETTGGMLSEVAGQAAAGQEFNLEEILIEGFADKTFTGASIINSAIQGGPKYSINGEKMNGKQFIDNIKILDDEAFVTTDAIKVENSPAVSKLISDRRQNISADQKVDSRISKVEDRTAVINLIKEQKKLEGNLKGNKTKLTQIQAKIDTITETYANSEVDATIEQRKQAIAAAVDTKFEAEFNKNFKALDDAKDVTGQEPVLFENDNDYLDAIEELHGPEVRAEAATSEGIFAGKGKVFINKAKARESIDIATGNNGAISVTSHEVLHPIFSALIGGAKTQGSFVKQFRTRMTGEQKTYVDKEIKRRYGKDAKSVTGTELMNVFSDGIIKNELTYDQTFFEKVGSYILRLFNKQGFDKLSFDNGKDVYNFLKEYNTSIKEGKLSDKAIDTIKKAEAKKGVKVADAKLLSKTQFSKTVAEAEAALDEAMDADPDNPNYLDNIDKAEAELEAAEEAAKNPPAAVPEVKKEVKSKPKVARPEKPTRTTDLGPRDPLSQKIMDTYNKDMEGVARPEYQASKPLPPRLEKKLVPMFEGYINTIVQQKFKQFATEALEFQDALSILRAEASSAIRTFNPAKNKDLAGYVKKIIQTRQSLMFKDANAEFAASLDDAKGVTATEDTQSIDRSGTVERGQATFDELDIVDDTLIEDIKQDLEKEIRIRVQKGTLSEMISVKKGRETYLVSWLENYVNKQLFKKLTKKLGAIAGVYPDASIPGSYIDFLNDPKTFDIITKALPIKSIKKSYNKLFPVERVGREVTAEGNPVFKIGKIKPKEFLTYFVKGNKSTVLERQKQLFREILEPLAKQVVADYATPENLAELKSIQELAPAESMDIIENIVIDAQLSNLESQLDRYKGEEKSFDIIQFSNSMSPNPPNIANELLSIAGLDAKDTLLKDSTKGKQKFYLDRLKKHYKTREEFMDFLPSFITKYRGLTAGLLGFVYREDGSYYDFYKYDYKKVINEKGETITDKKQLNELFKRGTASFKNKLLDSKGSVSEYSDTTKSLIKEVNKLIKEADLGKLTPNLNSGRIAVAKATLNENIVIDATLAQGVLNHLSKNNALNAKIAELHISLLRDFVKTSKNKKQAKAAVVNMLLATNNTVNGWRSLSSISSIIYNKNKVTDYYFEHNDSMRSVLPDILAQILGKGPISFKVDSSLIPVDLANTKNKKQETKVGNKSVTDEFYKKEIAKDKNLETVTIQFSLTGTTNIEFRDTIEGIQSSYFEVGGADYTAELYDFSSLKEAVMVDPELMIKEMQEVSGGQKVTTKEYKYLTFDRDGDSEIISAYDAEWNGKRYVYPESDTKQSLAVFGSLVNYFLGEIKKSNLKGISFTAAEPSRQRLYNSITERFSRQIGWNYSVVERPQEEGGHIYFIAKPSKIQLSKSNSEDVKKAKTISKEFNDIIQSATGIDTNKIVSEAKGKILGKKKGRFKFFLPPSAEDFAGLLYKLLGKKEKGDTQQAWFKKNLFDPFGAAMQEFESYKQNVTGIVNQLKKEIKKVPSALKKTNSTGFTNEVAVRVYLWAKNGYDIKGLTETDKKELIDIVEGDSDLIAFATQMDTVLNGYPEPQNDWLAGTITTDAINMINTTKRAEFLQEWQANADAVFTEDNLNKLRAAFGDNYVEAMEDMLYRMKSGRNRPSGANKLTNRFNNWVNDSVGTIMFFNTRSALLQTLSIVNFINWGDNNPIQAAKAFANQKQFWSDFSMLFNSDFLKQRRSGLKNDVNADDIANAAETATNKSKAVFASILKMGFLPTQMADSFAIAMGGASFVRNRISKYVSEGMDKKAAEEKAFLDFQEIAEETQQSSRPDRISQQQASPLGRIVLAFANTPMQYMRLTKKAFLDLKNGRGDAKTNITKIIYYSAVQNIIFSALQSALFAAAFEDDDEEAIKDKELRVANSMLDSILRGSGVYGAVASTLKNIVVEVGNQASKDRPDFTVAAQRALSISPPIDSKMRKLMGASRAFSYKTTRDKMKGFGLDNPAYYATGQIVSAAFNLPLDRVIRKADNLRVAVDNDTKYWQSIALMLGYSQWDLGLIQSEKKKKKSGFGKTTSWKNSGWKK